MKLLARIGMLLILIEIGSLTYQAIAQRQRESNPKLSLLDSAESQRSVPIGAFSTILFLIMGITVIVSIITPEDCRV
jgi:hypothetical protein